MTLIGLIAATPTAQCIDECGGHGGGWATPLTLVVAFAAIAALLGFAKAISRRASS